MKEKQKQELDRFLRTHTYPKIAAERAYAAEVREIAIKTRAEKKFHVHGIEEYDKGSSDTASLVKYKNNKGILPIFYNLESSLLDNLVFNNEEPLAYIIATEKDAYEGWKSSKKGYEKFKLGRIGLELFE